MSDNGTSLEDQMASMGLGDDTSQVTPETTASFSLATSDTKDKEALFIERDCYKLVRKVYTETKHPILLSGPTGSGKTRLASQLALEAGRESQRICLDDSVTLGEWLGTTGLKEVNGASVDFTRVGILAEAIQQDRDVILDEKSRMSANKVSPCNALLDSGKILVRGLGEITKHPDCRILATLNPHNGVYAGTHKQDPSTINRYYCFEIPQFTTGELNQLVPNGKYKEQMISFYQKVQEAIIKESLDFEFSIRNIQGICEILSLGGDLHEAVNIGLLNAVELTADREQRQLVLNIASAEFGTDILPTSEVKPEEVEF